MPRAVVDPNELRRFAIFINGVAISLRRRKSLLNSSLNNLKEVWRDEKYRQFERIYSEMMPQLEQFCKNAEEYAQYLQEKEKPLRRYLEQRY